MQIILSGEQVEEALIEYVRARGLQEDVHAEVTVRCGRGGNKPTALIDSAGDRVIPPAHVSDEFAQKEVPETHEEAVQEEHENLVNEEKEMADAEVAEAAEESKPSICEEAMTLDLDDFSGVDISDEEDALDSEAPALSLVEVEALGDDPFGNQEANKPEAVVEEEVEAVIEEPSEPSKSDSFTSLFK